MNDLIDRLRAYADLIYNNGITRKLRRHSVAALLHESADEIESLRAEAERINSWNARVSVCRDHVADIVDGLCVICSLHAAEERADNLQADVKSLQTLRDVVIENHGYWKGRAERLEEALRQIANQGPHYGPDGTYKTWRHWAEIARAALEQDKGGGYWPEMPKNGGPDWTGFDG